MVEEEKPRTLRDILDGKVTVSQLAEEAVVMYVAGIREINGDPDLPIEVIRRDVTIALRGGGRLVYPQPTQPSSPRQEP